MVFKKNERLAYFAGLIDGDGSISVQIKPRYSEGKSEKKIVSQNVTPSLKIQAFEEENYLKALSIYLEKEFKINIKFSKTRKTGGEIICLSLTNINDIGFLEEILPQLKKKKQQALLILLLKAKKKYKKNTSENRVQQGLIGDCISKLNQQGNPKEQYLRKQSGQSIANFYNLPYPNIENESEIFNIMVLDTGPSWANSPYKIKKKLGVTQQEDKKKTNLLLKDPDQEKPEISTIFEWNSEDLAQFSGFFDADGCIFANIMESKKGALKTQISVSVSITQKSKNNWFCYYFYNRINQKGFLASFTDNKRHKENILKDEWRLSNQKEVLVFLKVLFPYIFQKKKEIRLCILLIEENLKQKRKNLKILLQHAKIVDKISEIKKTPQKSRKQNFEFLKERLKNIQFYQHQHILDIQELQKKDENWPPFSKEQEEVIEEIENQPDFFSQPLDQVTEK